MTGVLHVVLARKPVEGTVAENCLRWGCGALWIDGCRVVYRIVAGGSLAQNTHLRVSIKRGKNTALSSIAIQKDGDTEGKTNPLGRFPANLILGGEEVVGLFPQTTSGSRTPVQDMSESKIYGGGKGLGLGGTNSFAGDTGSASRFFFNFAEQESDE